MPGWEDRIDLERLDLSSPTMCVLGQLYGDVSSGCRSLQISLRHSGFDAVAGRHYQRNLNRLAARWRGFIEARRVTKEQAG